MTLIEVIARLDKLDQKNDLLTIYAVEPWRPDCEAVVVEQPVFGR